MMQQLTLQCRNELRKTDQIQENVKVRCKISQKYVIQNEIIYLIFVILSMNSETDKEMSTSSQSLNPTDTNMKQVQKWVRNHGKQIPTADQIRQKYYKKLNIPLQQLDHLQKKDQISNEGVTLNIFQPKTSEQIRQRYINKLINMGIMRSEPSKKYQHLFIFDWDDTLLCTSFLSALNFLDLTPEIKEIIKKLDQVVWKLLDITIQKGDVYIITNATKGWVEYSSKLYLPLTNALLTTKPIVIISARSVYGEEFPGDYGRWKIQAFKSILKKIDTQLLTNLLCMGDSNIQIEAAHCLGKQFDKVVVKTIKFRQNPRPDQMVKQLGLVVEKFRQIFDSNKNLTIRLQRKK